MICALQWRHNGRDGVLNYQHHDCLFNCFFRRRSKKTSKLRVTGLCVGNSPVTGEFPAQKASNAENVSIWLRHHDKHNKNCGKALYVQSQTFCQDLARRCMRHSNEKNKIEYHNSRKNTYRNYPIYVTTLSLWIVKYISIATSHNSLSNHLITILTNGAAFNHIYCQLKWNA